MSKTRVKTTYEEMGAYGSTDTKTLYCFHNHSNDTVTFYEQDGGVADMCFEEWSKGKDKWDAMQLLWSPFVKDWYGELKEGVEYWYKAPWEEK